MLDPWTMADDWFNIMNKSPTIASDCTSSKVKAFIKLLGILYHQRHQFDILLSLEISPAAVAYVVRRPRESPRVVEKNLVLVLVGLFNDALQHNIGSEPSGLQPGGVYLSPPSSKISFRVSESLKIKMGSLR